MTGALRIDGQELPIEAGDTVLSVAARAGIEIPTLCHDPRLGAAGACRSCLVEVAGEPRLSAACTRKAQEGMVVDTQCERVERHRRNLLALYLADHPAARPLSGSSELFDMADRVGAPRDWGRLESRRDQRVDPNHYVHFDAERCILCARCVRYCDEVEAVNAIALAGRGPETTIATADQRSLLDTSCELCGGCIDTCPTGAMSEKVQLLRGAVEDARLEKVRTTCGYCGVGCQVDLNVDRRAGEGGRVVKVTSPEPGSTVNDGNLCVKGRFAYDFLDHEDRLTTPLVRDAGGVLREVSWDEALDRAAEGLLAVKRRHDAHALGFVSSSRCTMEENYLVQKLARAAFGTNNCHQCAAT